MKNSKSDYILHILCQLLTLTFCTRCFMALIRGTNSKCPCPICLVPDTQMSDGSTHPLRTSEDMQKIYNEAQKMTSGRRDEHLKTYGLCNVKVWRAYLGYNLLLNSTPYRVYSGTSRIQIHTGHFHLTIYMWTTLACLKITCGGQWKKWLRQRED